MNELENIQKTMDIGYKFGYDQGKLDMKLQFIELVSDYSKEYFDNDEIYDAIMYMFHRIPSLDVKKENE